MKFKKIAFFDKLVFLNDNLQLLQAFTNIVNVDDYNPESLLSSTANIKSPSLSKLSKKWENADLQKKKIQSKNYNIFQKTD